MSSNKTSLLGGTAGSYFDQKCPAGEYIDIFYGVTHKHHDVQPIQGIGTTCSDGTQLGLQGNSDGATWKHRIGKPYKNFSGAHTNSVFNSNRFVSTFMENGIINNSGGYGFNTSPWNDNCPSGAATGVYGYIDQGVVTGYGLQCGSPSNWCIGNLEDPMCAGVDAVTLNKACAKTFSETCTNRKAELTDHTMNLYCAANSNDAICSCYSQVPSYIPPEIAGLAPCWNKACTTTGYIPQNMRGGCPSITICQQDMNTSGDSNMLSNNIIIQDCKREIPQTNLANPDPQPDSKPDSKPPSDRAIQEANIAAERARNIAEVDSDIWTPGFIIILIIVGVIVGMCVYSLIQHFLKKKESDEDDDEDKPKDE